jgi:hypothetical protein
MFSSFLKFDCIIQVKLANKELKKNNSFLLRYLFDTIGEDAKTARPFLFGDLIVVASTPRGSNR